MTSPSLRSGSSHRRSWKTVVPLGTMVTAVLVASALPLLRARDFYVVGDSGVQWLPVGRRVGELLGAGESHLMDPTMWRGGNFVAEAGFGIWNPLVLLLDLTVLQLDDLEIGAALFKGFFLIVLSIGVYFLAREYGATPWPAALAGTAVPLMGFTLWTDASTWSANLVSFAFAPYVWLAARRLARGVGNPMWVVVAGALCVTAGNPYSNIVVFVAVVAVVVEFGDLRNPAPLWALVGCLAAIGLIALFVYLPFRQTSVVGFRETGIANDETLAPGLGDLIGLSTPTMTPFIRNFGNPVVQFPAVYLAWFVLPLAPWMRWRSPFLPWRKSIGLAVFGAVFLILVAGPSHFWFFRWPVRLVPYLFLPVMIAWVVSLSAGLVTNDRVRRATASFLVVGMGTYLAWADVPDTLSWHLKGLILVLGLTSGAVLLATRPKLFGGYLVVATLLMLAFQLQWKPINTSFRDFNSPSSAAQLEADFGDRFVGNTVSVTRFEAIPPDDRRPEAAYRDITIGNLDAVAGVETISTYSGVGFTAHDEALCLGFDGSMCADGWNRLWGPIPPSDIPLVDLLRAETVVVQRAIVDTRTAPVPPGWRREEVTDHVVIWRRDQPLDSSNGRLSDVRGPIRVLGRGDPGPHRETVEFERTGPGNADLTFARLAWPGYVASVEGTPLTVGSGTAGLLTIAIPDGVDGGEILLTWRPPRWRLSLAALALGAVFGFVTQVGWTWTRRRTAGSSDPPVPR